MWTEMEVRFVDRVFDSADPPKSSRELALFLFPELTCHELGAVDLDVKALTQGTTNGLFKVSLLGSGLTPVLVKVYGDGTEITIDRNKELKVHQLLSEKQLSSSPLFRFVNGHAYPFISGVVCSEHDVSRPTIWRGIAREIARWHATLPVIELHPNDPREVLYLEPSIWSTARKWLDAIPSKPLRSSANKNELIEAFGYLTGKLLRNTRVSTPLVLGHGDLLCGNIILQDTVPSDGLPGAASIRLIDYEHATFCPAAFELANHFAEWAGFQCDYSLLPTKTTRRGFIRHYLVTEAEVDELMDQVDVFRGFPGFHWGLCALIQAETSTGDIQFDYGGYAEKRLAEYWAWRNAEDGNKGLHEKLSFREERWACL